MARVSTRDIISFKNEKKIVMITAYDALFANLFDEHVDIILVGDSLNMSFNGQEDTIKDISIKEMIYHTKAVCRGSKKSMVILDMPFGTYANKKQAFKNASLSIRKTDATAVKIEGGEEVAHIVKHLVKNSIAIMGHIGLLPQNVRVEGGYIIKGKNEKSKIQLIKDAKELEKAGAFAIICEGVKTSVAREIAKSINIPLIGIGSGVDVDGQVLVFSDMLGLYDKFTPKFARKYLDGSSLVKEAIKKYRHDIENEYFPTDEESY